MMYIDYKEWNKISNTNKYPLSQMMIYFINCKQQQSYPKFIWGLDIINFEVEASEYL